MKIIEIGNNFRLARLRDYWLTCETIVSQGVGFFYNVTYISKVAVSVSSAIANAVLIYFNNNFF